jgi:hypothetical protein
MRCRPGVQAPQYCKKKKLKRERETWKVLYLGIDFIKLSVSIYTLKIFMHSQVDLYPILKTVVSYTT